MRIPTILFKTLALTGSIRRLRPLVKGKTVLLLGSSPDPILSDLEFFDVIASANGGAGRLPEPGPRPHITFVTSNLLNHDLPKNDWGEVIESIGSKTPTSLLVSIRNGAHFETFGNSSRFQVNPHQVAIVRLGTMRRITARMTRSLVAGSSPNGLPSTGILATILCLFAGAKSVTLSGFRLWMSDSASESEHYYDASLDLSPESKKPRYHSAADLLCVSSLAILGRSVQVEGADFEPALKNWGDEGPKWFRDSSAVRIFWGFFAPW